jgi:hypothetical protein
LHLAVACLNATIYSETRKAKAVIQNHGGSEIWISCRLPGVGLGLTQQEAASQINEWVGNQPDTYWRSKPGQLGGYPDPFLTLLTRLSKYFYALTDPTGGTQCAQDNAVAFSGVSGTTCTYGGSLRMK